jgi:hypothetical protein
LVFALYTASGNKMIDPPVIMEILKIAVMEIEKMVVKQTLVKALIVASSALFAVSAQANLIINGGFEESAVENGWGYGTENGWSGDAVEVWDNFGAIGPYEGDKHAELNSHGSTISGSAFSIFQTFSTDVGKTYNLFFAYGARSSNDEAFQVDVTGSAAMTMSDHVINEWSTYTGTFVATETDTTLRFTSVYPTTGTVGNFLDDVRVTVPEPGSLALFGFGLIGLVVARRKAK